MYKKLPTWFSKQERQKTQSKRFVLIKINEQGKTNVVLIYNVDIHWKIQLEYSRRCRGLRSRDSYVSTHLPIVDNKTCWYDDTYPFQMVYTICSYVGLLHHEQILWLINR